MPTQQETFDKIVDHLRKQKIQARSKDKRCSYKTEEGLKCAVGCLIPEELYDRALEGLGIVSSAPNWNKTTKLMFSLGYDLKLLELMQAIHDLTRPIEWEEQFELVANKLNLVYAPYSKGEELT